MELNDINLLFWAGLLSLSLIGLTVFLAVYGGLAYFLSHLIGDHLWPTLLNVVEGFGQRGARVSKWLRRSAFVLVWVVGPLALEPILRPSGSCSRPSRRGAGERR